MTHLTKSQSLIRYVDELFNMFFNTKLKIQQRIGYKVLSNNYKTLQSGQPSYLHNVQSNRTTRSSEIIPLQRPSVRSRLKVTDSPFTHHAHYSSSQISPLVQH